MARYFGYAWGNNIDAVKGYCNLYTVVAYDPKVSLEAEIAKVYAAGMKSIVALQPILCDEVGKLRSDWKSRLDAFRASQVGAINGRVVGIYLPDEPYHNGWTAVQLVEVSNTIARYWPNHGQILIEAYSKVRNLYTNVCPVPPMIGWIGWDRYGVLPLTDDEYQKDLSYIQARLRVGQRIVLVAEGQWFKGYEEVGYTIDIMGPIMHSYGELSKNPLVDAVLVYTWPNNFEYPGFIGSEGLPKVVKDVHVAVGKMITGKK